MAEKNLSPQEVLSKMLKKDHFTEWLGLEVLEIRKAYCKLRFTVRRDMLNGFESIHGGVMFSACDSAFAFACNSYGILTVALDANISYARPAFEGQQITVEASEIHIGNKTGFYHVTAVNEAGEIVALFKGTAYRTSKQH